MASELQSEGRYDEALEQYKLCLDKIAAARLDPEHLVNMATVYNLALVYDDIDDQENAEKLCEEPLDLYLNSRGPNHQDTHIVLENIADVRRHRGNTEGEFKCLKIWAEGSKATYSLANSDTLQALRRLEDWYRRHDRENEAEALSEKILEGERILANASC